MHHRALSSRYSPSSHPGSFVIITQTKSTRKGRAEQKIEFLGDRALEILELRFLGRRHFQIWQHFATSLLNCCSICRSLTPNICLSTRGQCSIVPGKNLLRCQNRQKVQTRLGQKMRTMISCAQLRLPIDRALSTFTCRYKLNTHTVCALSVRPSVREI